MDGPGAFVWLPDRGEVPVKALRFAIGDRERRIVSGAWTVQADRHGLFRIAGAGAFGLVRLALRRRGLAFAHAEVEGDAIVGRGIAPPGPRSPRWIAAPDQPPWHAASLSFPSEFLRRAPCPAGDTVRRPLILLPDAGRGRMVRIAFLLVASISGRVDYEDRSDLYLGRVTDGRGRSLLVMRRIVESDLGGYSARLSRLSPGAPLALHARAAGPGDPERGLLLLEPGRDHLDIVELHNLHRATPLEPVARAQLDLFG